ncbi:flagellar hook-length control protein FliK [Bosea sp. (in: a-proteobacteria)]|jgi:hypothetical protein|uniref:flagellar hook-length control protein FliK n=1 Tax=Bosea sp. (in: a-proteobacteria) TaxID=1871050 RepID=UPI003F6FAB11
MNLAALAQSQTFATLLAALAPTGDLAIGKTIEARLISLDGNGAATALVNGVRIDLVLAGPEARQAALQPGATLTLRIDAPEDGGKGLRATLIEVRPAGADTVPRTAQPVPLDRPGPAATAATSLAMATLPALTAARPQGAEAAMVGAQPPARDAAPAGPARAPQLDATLSPRALAGPLLGAALARQDSLAPLFANLRVLANGSVSLVLPKPLLGLIDQILAQAMPVERRAVTAPTLKQAVARSGLFLEAREAEAPRSDTPGRGTDAPRSPAAMPPDDLKAGLRALREMLRPLIAIDAPPPDAKPADAAPRTEGEQPPTRPAPPRRDGTLVSQQIAEPSLTAAEKPVVIARTLLDQTEAALDRIKLAQFASLPPESARPEAAQSLRWVTEIPLTFQAGTAILPLHIEKEPPRRNASGATAPIWRMRFALDAEPMGPLQGVVTLQGRAVSVSLWAEREDTSQFLQGAAPDLQAALANAQFEDGTVDIHTGHPQARHAVSGQFLDRLS